MIMKLKGGRIFDTDYFGSNDHRLGIPWCAVEQGLWHVLIPQPRCDPPSLVKARPVLAREEPDNWRWRLELPHWHLRMHYRCFEPMRPSLPEPGTRHERTVVFYHSIMREDQRGEWFFGSIPRGVQVWCTTHLWLERRRYGRSEREYD